MMSKIEFELRPREECRMHNLSIPMLESEKNAIREKAKKHGVSMASYARWVLMDSVKGAEK